MRAIDINDLFISGKEWFKSTRENRPIQSFELELLDLPAHTKNELAPFHRFWSGWLQPEIEHSCSLFAKEDQLWYATPLLRYVCWYWPQAICAYRRHSFFILSDVTHFYGCLCGKDHSITNKLQCFLMLFGTLWEQFSLQYLYSNLALSHHWIIGTLLGNQSIVFQEFVMYRNGDRPYFSCPLCENLLLIMQLKYLTQD